MSYATQSLRLTKASSQYMTVADSASLSLPGDDITIEFWIKMKETLGGSVGRWLVTKSTGNTTDREYEITYDTFAGNKLKFYIFTSGVPTNFFESALTYTLTEDTWYHVAITCDVSAAASVKANWYINGVLQTSVGTNFGTGCTTIFDSTKPLRIGQSDPVTAGYYPDAQFSLIRIWDVVRTGTQIADNMCVALGPSTNLQAEWILDGNGNDNSGNSNNLSGVASPGYVGDIPGLCAVSSENFLPAGVASASFKRKILVNAY